MVQVKLAWNKALLAPEASFVYLGIVGPALLAAVLQGRTVLSRCQDIASQALHRFRQSLASEAPFG